MSDKIQAISLVKSPLNYTGGKYKLLQQIMPYFPKQIDTFVDLFAGGLNVGINVNAGTIIANDINREIIELYKFMQQKTPEYMIDEIDHLILKYGFTDTFRYGYEHYNCNSNEGVAKYNKVPFKNLRNDYNHQKSPLLFYMLIIFAFNNQIRFNNKGQFNMPVNKRDFNGSVRQNLTNFMNQLNQKNIIFHSQCFSNLSIPKNALVYVDPPYLITTAAYNESNGWNVDNELALLSYLEQLNHNNIKFILSNVLNSKGATNSLLDNWRTKFKTIDLDYNYSNCNYQKKNRNQNSTNEILITNIRTK